MVGVKLGEIAIMLFATLALTWEKRWYVTGDLVALDDEGFIHFRGRLKRFLKVAGEMISLPALEEPFLRRYPPPATPTRL